MKRFVPLVALFLMSAVPVAAPGDSEAGNVGVIREVITTDGAESGSPPSPSGSPVAPARSAPGPASYYFFGNPAGTLPAIAPVPICQSPLVLNWRPAASERAMLAPYEVYEVARGAPEGTWDLSVTVPIAVATVKVKVPAWEGGKPPRGLELPRVGDSVHVDGDACGATTTVRIRFDLPGLYRIHLVPAAGSSGAPVFAYTVSAGIDLPLSPTPLSDPSKEWAYVSLPSVLAVDGTSPRFPLASVAPDSDALARLGEALAEKVLRAASGEELRDGLHADQKARGSSNLRLLGYPAGVLSPPVRSLASSEPAPDLMRLARALRGSVDLVWVTLPHEAANELGQALADELSSSERSATVVAWTAPLGLPPAGWMGNQVVLTHEGARPSRFLGKRPGVEKAVLAPSGLSAQR